MFSHQFENSREVKLLRDYRKETGHRFYIYSHTAILLLAYEVLIRLSMNPHVREYNGVDIWFPIMESLLPYGTLIISLGIIIHRYSFIRMDWLGIKDAQELNKDKAEKKKRGGDWKPKDKAPFKKKVKWDAFAYIILEGFIYGSLIYALLPLLLKAFLTVVYPAYEIPLSLDANPTLWDYHTNFFQDFALALGSGIYDEMIFRQILTVILLALFGWWQKDKWKDPVAAAGIIVGYKRGKFVNQSKPAKSFAIVVGAMLYAVSHFILPFGDPFSLYGILFRFLFGLIMYYIFTNYRLHVAAWTHVFFNCWYFLLVKF